MIGPILPSQRSRSYLRGTLPWHACTPMDATGVPSTSASSVKAPELSSILTQVQTLQQDREKLMKELEETKSSLGKLQEGKRAAMKNVLDTVITKWISESVDNEDARKQFQEGMDRLVTDTWENSGIWQVACAASATHAKQTAELEKLRSECTELRTLQGGQFVNETSRKRTKETEDSSGFDIWKDFIVTPN